MQLYLTHVVIDSVTLAHPEMQSEIHIFNLSNKHLNEQFNNYYTSSELFQYQKMPEITTELKHW